MLLLIYAPLHYAEAPLYVYYLYFIRCLCCIYLVSSASSICSTSPSPFSTSRHVTCRACVLIASFVCLCVLDFMSVVCSVIIYCEVFTQLKFSAFSLFVFQMFNNIWDGGNLKVEV